MPVARSAPRLLSFTFVVGVGFFCCFLFLAEFTERQGIRKRRSEIENRKIVAFSLLKQIEIESEEFDCREKFVKPQKDKNGNDVWTKIGSTNIFVYSLYHDRRLYPYGYLRIIAMVKGSWNETFCQIKSSDNQYYITRAKATKIWSKTWNQNDTHDYYNPFLISCHVPLHKTPIHVSLSTEPCHKDPHNFKISTPETIPPQNISNFFTICVKPLNFAEDISEKLLQWLVINKILGATKIELYLENLSKPTFELLEKYQKSDSAIVLHNHHNLESSHLDEATHLWQKRRYEIITYNDCLYRNIATSHFIIPIDVDEIIVPRHVSTWPELLHEFLSEGEDKFASYTVRNAYYLRQFNKKKRGQDAFFFENVVRSGFSGQRESVKSFISARNTLTVFNHYALRTLKPGVRRYKFLEKEAVQMNHYKDNCDTVVLPECAKYLSSRERVADDVIFKYKKRFYGEYDRVKGLLNRTLLTL